MSPFRIIEQYLVPFNLIQQFQVIISQQIQAIISIIRLNLDIRVMSHVRFITVRKALDIPSANVESTIFKAWYISPQIRKTQKKLTKDQQK